MVGLRQTGLAVEHRQRTSAGPMVPERMSAAKMRAASARVCASFGSRRTVAMLRVMMSAIVLMAVRSSREKRER